MAADPTLVELDARAADVAAGIVAAERQLRDALLTGGNTAEVRLFLGRLRAEQAELATVRAALLVREAEEEAKRTAAAGATLAAEVENRLHDRLAELTPPEAPQSVRR